LKSPFSHAQRSMLCVCVSHLLWTLSTAYLTYHKKRQNKHSEEPDSQGKPMGSHAELTLYYAKHKNPSGSNKRLVPLKKGHVKFSSNHGISNFLASY
jgi:hypothetical protein